MRQEFEHSDRWRHQDDAPGLTWPFADPHSEHPISHDSLHTRPDNIRVPFEEKTEHAPSSPRPDLEAKNLADLWKQKNSRTYHVLLVVEPGKAQTLTATQWHDSQRCTIRPDGYGVIEFRVQCLSALKPWLKHHAPIIQIIRTVAL